jgi:hypothetical protein
VIDGIARAASAAGITVEAVVPAQSAWTIAAVEQHDSLEKGEGDVSVRINSHAEVLQIREGSLVGIRRARVEDLTVQETRYTLSNPEEQAATFAPAVKPILELASDTTYADRRAGARSLARRMLYGAAAAAVLVAAGLYVKRSRELQKLQDERHALAAQVARATASRTSRAEVAATLKTLADLEMQAPRWSAAMSELSARLPSGAYVSVLRATGDTLSAEGLADHAGAVFPALQKLQTISAVQGAGPIRREAKPNAKPVEHFSIVGRLTPVAGGSDDKPRATAKRGAR